MRLKIRIPLYFALAIAIAGTGAALGLAAVASSLETFDTRVMRLAAAEHDIGALSNHFRTQVQEWKDTLLRGSDDDLRNKHWGAFQSQEHWVADHARGLQGRLGDPAQEAALVRFIAAHARMAQRYAEGFDKFSATGFEPSVGDMAVRGVDREPAQLLQDLADAMSSRRQADADAAFAGGQRAIRLALLALLAACGASLGLGLVLARRVIAPLQEATQAAHEIAQGRLSGRIAARGHDETGQLLQGLIHMQQRLRTLVSDVRDSAQGVAAASVQIAQGHDDLGRRTEEQAAALQVTAATMEQLGATAGHSAEGARQANVLASHARDVAGNGGVAVDRVVATMRDIRASSQRISEIIAVIDGLAFQTNLLALNAAVEAARAGEQGRGFAVVAAEVRGLARRSADAAREIAGLITTSVERVEEGSRLADEAGRTMRETVGAIQRVSEVAGEISTASEQQRAGVLQVGQEVDRMDEAVGRNAALVEQGGAAAARLRRQADGLVEAVEVFCL